MQTRGKCRYGELPRLSSTEFDALVEVAQWRPHGGQVISAKSIAMARAVLLEGMSYREAAEAHGSRRSSLAHQAVRALLRYRERLMAMSGELLGISSERLMELVRYAATEPRYANLPRLTAEQFDVLVESVRARNGKRGRPMSDKSVAMARAVLLEGASYREAQEAQGVDYSCASRAVALLLQCHERDVEPVPVFAHDPFRLGAAKRR